ncbi:HdeD family acid-resistance protein [Streptomyces fradiae]|uniref:HdeD family acid-resistance protein n=1 Tax=Streptomyces fradiae TaxID=1906 RepID=UPI002943A6A6|nr:HdeD family acid-resistance protein [Streptomyces fradiae]WOI61446.1 HdeD family acid-resistance protein [Streptomyces fradiae]
MPPTPHAPDAEGSEAAEGAGPGRHLALLVPLGVVLVAGGLFGLVYTGLATLTSMLVFGWLLLVGGAVGLVQALESRGTGAFWPAAVVAALNIAAGFVVIRHPGESAEAFTMFAALLFLTGGVFRLVGSAVVRGPRFGWSLLQGAFGIVLGLLVLFDWPRSSLYVLGTFFSLALLFDGLGLIAAGAGGAGGRGAPGSVPAAGSAPAAGSGREAAPEGVRHSGTRPSEPDQKRPDR